MKEIALESLRKNIMTLPSGKFLTAGQNQFKTLWTRDFCHSVPGLLAAGEIETAESHLSLLLNSLHEDGLVPRVLDNVPVQLRVAYQAGKKLIPILPGIPFKEPLRPQYTDEHGSHAFDSNILLILACRKMPVEFQKKHAEKIQKASRWYDDKFVDGLIFQKPFSDWQDTTKREGHTFLLNLFYYEAFPTEDLRQKIKSTFWNGSVFLSQKNYEVVSVEGNLFALLSETFLNEQEKQTLWNNLKLHPLITIDGAIGRCSYPDWPSHDLAIHIRLANLKLYHGSMTWSWIMGLGLKTAQAMGDFDFATKQFNHISRLVEKHGEVGEIYDPTNKFNHWKSWLLEAEHPFAWGAAYLVDALSEK